MVRTAVLVAVMLIAVVVAVVIGGGQVPGPGVITFEPATWRCDGSERTWSAAIPAAASELVLELRTGGAEGRVVIATPVTRDSLAPYRQEDGTYLVASKDVAAPECAQPPGRYWLVIRDAGTASVVASGELSLEP